MMKKRERKYLERKKCRKDFKRVSKLMYIALSITPTMDGKERDMKPYEGMLK